MRLLMITGTANDVFIYNLSKWLKYSMEIEIDIYEFFPSPEQRQNIKEFATVYSSSISKWFCSIKGVGYSLMQVYSGKQLGCFLQGRNYDFIHCHWPVAPLVVNHNLKNHCRKLYVTFWGGEVKVQKIAFSHKLYMRGLRRLLKETDNIVGYNAERPFYEEMFPDFKGRYLSANLAPTILEDLYKLMERETKNESKQKLGVPPNKELVLIGYSGKTIHRHLDIIERLSKNNSLKDKICLLAPMTRGARPDYVDKVERALKQSGYDYLFFKDCFFSENEMARLRNATDIALQLSTRDAYSRSIIECLCAKAVVIYGEWLEYSSFFKYDGFEAVAVPSIDSAIDVLSDIVTSLEAYSVMTEMNSINGKRHNLWSNCIKEWVELYK